MAVRLGEAEVSARHFLNVLDELVDHASIVDKDLNVLWGNRVAKNNFGEKLIGMKCYTAHHGRDVPCPECLVQKTFRDGQIHEHEVMVVPEGAEPIYFHCNSYVLKEDDKGNPELVIEVSKIITDRVKLGKDMDRIVRLTNDREEEMIKLKNKVMILEQKLAERPIAKKQK